MKSNPFYALSASAMLLGCWLLGEALELQAGQLASLLLLMSVLQLYEGLLVGLGAFLVRSGRARSDGRGVLVLESVFLMDATLLAAECVTADAGVGTAVAVATMALAAAKLAWVRRVAAGLLSRRSAVLLGVQAALILSVPVAAAHLARARLFDPIVLYGFWWATLALPVAQRALGEETGEEAAAAPRAHAVWTWVPSAMALLHLWAVGYIHTIDFRMAFIAPFLFGLAVTAGKDALVRQVALPGVAVLCSLGQGGSLGFRLSGADGLFVSPLRLALVGVALSWTYLAWRDRERWLAILAVGCGAASLLGSWVARLSDALGRLLDAIVPRDAFGWGVLTVIAAFVLLGAGARRSLAGDPRRLFRGPGPLSDPPERRWREAAAVSLALGVFAMSAMAAALEASPPGHPRQMSTGALASCAAAVGLVAALRAHVRAAREGTDPAAQRLAGLAMAAGALGFLLAVVPLAASDGDRAPRAENEVVGDLRTMISAPRKDVPGGAFEKHGYRFTHATGPSGSGAWIAVPTEPGYSGIRGVCGDSSGVVCFTADGKAPRTGQDGKCDLATCSVLR